MAYSAQDLEDFESNLTFGELCTAFGARLKGIAFHGEGDGRFCSAVELRAAFAGSPAVALLDDFTRRARAFSSPDAPAVPSELRDLFSTFETSFPADEFSLSEVITPEQQNLASDIAWSVEVFFSVDGDHSADALCAFLAQHLGLTVQKTPGSGYFFRVARINVDDAIPGRGGNFTFAIIPPGHTAPAHMHRAPAGTQFAGEYTVTLNGPLRYYGSTPDGAVDSSVVETHTREMGVRVSPADSFDRYLPQEDLWVGFYIQPQNCEIEKKA